MNRFGIAHPDQPVLCEDRVRYVGDAVAAVAADTLEIAEQALRLIEVDYESPPIVEDAEYALTDDSPQLHPQGNLLHRKEFKRGDVATGTTVVHMSWKKPTTHLGRCIRTWRQKADCLSLAKMAG